MPVLLEMPRYTSILYSRLKYECSGLNAHLYKCNIIDSPACACRTGDEDVFHFIYQCPFYVVPREHLMFDLDRLGLENLSIPVLFNLDAQLAPDMVLRVQNLIYTFIRCTRRFQT